MQISVFGLGYVGTVSAACLAARGHQVIGVDINQSKVDLINSGSSPIVEPGLSDLVREARRKGTLRATTRAREAIVESELSIICVQTPSARNGSMNTQPLASVCHEVGTALAGHNAHHTVVVRSTMAPGTFRKLVVPALEQSSRRNSADGLSIAVNPEFLREGSAVADFHKPSRTVVGATDRTGAAKVAELYRDLPAPVVQTTPEIAEITKYIDNPWHALKVAFANEIGNLCKAVGVDSHAAIEIFLMDRTLNISNAYLRPGFAFGGSCLPKDIRGLCYLGQQLDLSLPVLRSVLESNAAQIERSLEWIQSFGKRRIGVLGCTFKPDTDDLRESPYVILIERLLGKGMEIRIFDRNLQLSMLMGANREYLFQSIPHISKLLVGSAEEATRDAELILLTAGVPEYLSVLDHLNDDQILLDFANAAAAKQLGSRYHGVNW